MIKKGKSIYNSIVQSVISQKNAVAEPELTREELCREAEKEEELRTYVAQCIGEEHADEWVTNFKDSIAEIERAEATDPNNHVDSMTVGSAMAVSDHDLEPVIGGVVNDGPQQYASDKEFDKFLEIPVVVSHRRKFTEAQMREIYERWWPYSHPLRWVAAQSISS